jgi:drug/metabolite transporter (DMT)-like permease
MAELPPRLKGSTKYSATTQAIFWITVAGACFAITMMAVRKVTVDLHVFEAVFFRCIIGIAFMLPWLIRHKFAGLKTKRMGYLAIRGSLAFFVSVFYYTAASLIPLADLTALTFTRPIFGTIAAIFFLNEVVHGRRWSAIAVSFIGMLIIIRPGFSDLNLGILLVLGGVALQTVNTILVKILTRTEHPDTIALYHTIFILPLALIPAIYVWQTPTLEQFGWLIIIGGVGVMVQRAMARAFAVADASFVLALSFLRLPIAALIGFAVFGEIPGVWMWAGATIICASSVYIARREAMLADKGRN